MTNKEQAKIDELVDLLGCSIDEAISIVEHDKKIDKGERTEYDLSPEQEKLAKKYANVTEHKKPAVYKFDKRERKADTTKEGVIQAIYDFLQSNGYEGVNILNPSKLIGFRIGEDDYEFNLIRKRKKK